MKTIVTTPSLAKKILSKFCKEFGIKDPNVTVNNHFGYLETIDFDKPDMDYKEVEYQSYTYKVKYVDGCFNPFFVMIKDREGNAI